VKRVYTVAQAQRQFAAVVRAAERGALATITRHDRPVAYVIGAERLAAIAETMELLGNAEAVRAIRAARTGRGRARDAAELPG
jgi:antitoxin YefM